MFSQVTGSVYIRARFAAALVLFALAFSSAAFAQGLVESATGNAMRPKFSGRDVPSSRGRFTFPSPYNTEAVRLTEASDCNGSDCVRPVGYAYWSNINNHVGNDTMLVFLSLKGQGPTLFSYNKKTGETRNRGSIFAGDNTHGWATLSIGEGWYFSGTRPNALYINEPGGARLFRYDVLAHSWETVFDASSQMPGKYIWQVHSSNDDRVHSFTVRDKGSYAMEGCAIYREDQRKFVYYARKGNDFDECQIDKSGKWLLIKEQLDGAAGEDNRVIDIDRNTERVLNDPDGAAGHSDLGYGYLVAEDNFNNRPGAVRVWDFNKDLRGGQPNSPVQGQGTLVYQIADWMSLAQHIAHGNSKPGLPLDQQVACASNGTGAHAPRTNEIVCFKLNGSLETLVVAPTLTDVNASGNGGMDGEAYWKFPKGNLDITGEYFIWTTNGGTSRNDAFIVKVPLNRLGASGSGSPEPGSGSTGPAATPLAGTCARARTGTGASTRTSAVARSGADLHERRHVARELDGRRERLDGRQQPHEGGRMRWMSRRRRHLGAVDFVGRRVRRVHGSRDGHAALHRPELGQQRHRPERDQVRAATAGWQRGSARVGRLSHRDPVLDQRRDAHRIRRRHRAVLEERQRVLHERQRTGLSRHRRHHAVR